MPKEKTSNDLLKEYLEIYHSDSKSKTDELEIKFGTKHWNPITRTSFDNVIEKIKSEGWKLFNDDSHLNIQNEYTTSSGDVKMSNIRTEIKGMNDIREYCKTDKINVNNRNISFTQKFRKRTESRGNLDPVDFDNFHFRVNFKTEKQLYQKYHAQKIQIITDGWTDTKKTFRYLKRFSFRNNYINKTVGFPFQIDCSIVKTSNKNRNYLIPEYKIEQSNVFENKEIYEIELELINDVAKYMDTGDLLRKIKYGIKLILSGLQQTNFPVAFSERELILKQYHSLVHFGEKVSEVKKISSREFIGPSSISLEMPNIIPLKDTSSEPNINNPYTVTDKADGMRKLLYISKLGKIYLIDVNMNVQFTGCITKNKSALNTLIDGEHVINNLQGEFINKYCAFDIYILNRKDLRPYPFIEGKDLVYENKELERDIFRKVELEKYLNKLSPINVVSSDKKSPMTFTIKKFYNNNDENIFIQCKKIMDDVDNSLFEYETDGLIFTPSFLGVGSDKIGVAGPKNKITWMHSFKWKPSEYNTIDFLVTIKKDPETKQEIIGNILNNGTDMSDSTQFKSYKTMELRVGYDETRHGFINPLDDIINDNLPKKKWSNYNEDKYKPVLFQPTNPTPEYPIYLSNIILNNQSGINYMLTEDESQSFEDWNIVEFKFVKDNKPGWQWVPIRARYDKTSELQSGYRKNYGNAHHVAQSVWRSINNPITKKMITTGTDIPKEINDADVYYKKKSKETTTNRLRSFHNFIKRKLIINVCKRGDTLFDQSVGKAGDLQKWINAELSFVFGIDYSKDNIENRLDGACARYLNACKRNRILPNALFINGDSSKNIRNGDATANTNTKATTIVNAVFGTIPSDNLEKGILKNYGKGKNGFDIISNQFSIHYFWKDKSTLHNFLRNVSETCKVGGYFIGTCYDGKKVFDKLKYTDYQDSMYIINGDEKMWEIKKLYNNDSFPDTEECIGYTIDVFQESINTWQKEHLVNFDYLTSALQLYGFEPITDVEAKSFEFPSAIGSFKDEFDIMDEKIDNRELNPHIVKGANKMSSNEKEISFLNNYFIYKKKSNPDAKSVSNMIIHNMKNIDEEQEEDVDKKPKIKRRVKKLKKKLKLPLG